MPNVIGLTRIYGLVTENGPQTSNGMRAPCWFMRFIEQDTITKKCYGAWEGIVAVEDLLHLLTDNDKIKRVRGE